MYWICSSALQLVCQQLIRYLAHFFICCIGVKYMGVGSLLSLANLAASQMIVIDKMGNVIVANVGDKVPNGAIILEKGNFQLNPGEQGSGISAKFVESEGNSINITNDVEDIIAGIEQGIDPTALGEEFATAAGGAASSSLTTSATLNLSDEETIAQTSFDTSASFTPYYSETQSLALVDYLNNSILATSIPAASATIILDDITDDNLINSDESESTVTVTGSVSGDVQSGDAVTLTFEDESGNQTKITGEVSSDATGNLVFSIDVPGSVLASDRDTMIVASVTGMTSSGVIYADSTTKAFATDLSADTDTTISITRTSNSDSDSTINSQEMTDVSFTINGVDSDADTVLVTFSDGDAATGDITVEAIYGAGSGTWVLDNVDLSDLASGNITATVTVTDVNDNQAEVQVILDLDKSADEDSTSFTVQVVSDDEVVNAEKVSDVTVKLSGVDDDAVSVVVTFSDGTNSISVNASQDSNGNWVVNDTDLSSLNDGDITVTAVVTDDAGNTVTASDSLVKDTVAIGAGEGANGEDVGPTVTIVDDLNQDGYINGTEDNDGQISAEIVIDADELANGGSVSVVIENGDDNAEIELSLDDNGDLVDGDGNSYDYDDTTGTITLPIEVAEGDEVTVTATQTDAAGNESVSGSDNATLDTTAIGAGQGSNGENVGPTVTIVDDLNQDGYINGTEDSDGQISAEIVIDADELANGGSVTVVIENGDTTTEIELSLDDNGDLVDGSGNTYDYDDTTGTITLPIEVAEGDEVTVTATQTDSAGNESVSGEASALLDTSYSAQNESIVTDEDTSVVIDVLANEDTGTSIVSDSVALDDRTKGTVELNEDGTLSFTPAENYNGDVTITYTVEDQYGNTDVATVTVTINGTNDAATIAGDTSVTASETDAALSLSGTLTSSDVDNADNTFTANTIVGTNGTFSIAENGEWTFEANSAFDELNVGDSKVESFTVTSVDGTEQVVTVTINGTNDAATIAGDTSVTASETDAALSLSGTLTSSDVDNADNTFTANTIVGTNGTFSIAENGEWTFEANSAFDELNVGDSKVESFTVTSVDGTEQVVTVTINGTNDAATIAGDTSVTASETDAALSLSGTLTSSDVDNADNTFTANTIVGTNGTFSIAENGEWTFEANSAFDELNVGDSKVESFTVTSVDGTEQVVTVTINGTNDAATIAGDTSVTASETDAALSLSGTLTSSDVDNADNTFTANTIVGTNGTFSIAENGEWTFEANSAFDELNVGDSKVESFTVTSVDGTEQVVTVTINGTNDAATIAGDTSVTASETDAALSLSGTLTSSDVDNADNTFTANTIVGTNGTFSIAENGEWTFEANSAFDELNVGDSKVESFTVTSVDGTEQVVTVTINGTNDAATIAGDTSVTASETDAALSLSGTLTSSDVDNADNTFTANTIVGTNGTFSIAENGEWTFEANSAFDELNVGDSKVESFTVTSVDGTEQVVTVTINGTNDAATIAGDTSVTASETDAALSLSGTLTSSDVDNADNTFTANTIVGTNGTFSIAENGEWTFEANSAFDELNVGDSKVESFTVTSVDGTEQVVTVTINGTNDAATIAGDTSVTASETDAALSLSGTLTSSDVDNADNTFTANTIVGTNGTFSIAENGEWTFEANSAFDELNVGDSKVESFTVTSVDGTEQVVTVTINGTNDAATIAGDTSVTASETDAALSLSGTLTSSDVDNADNTFTANTIVGTNGTFSIAENGEWTFEANSAFDELNVGDSKVESFTVTSVDGTEQVVTVTINGTNDAATIAGDTSVTASETDAALSLSGTLTSSDVDNADNTFTANTIVGTNGTFSIAENGEWTFEANSAFDELNVGDSKVESFTVTSVDGTEQVVTVTINGTNDAATIAGDTSVTASETDAALSLSGTLTSSDVDNADNTFTANTIVGTNGTFSIAENGEWTFEANSAFDELNVGDSKVESFTVTSVDGTEQVVTVTINGTNDAATIAGDTSVTASETDAALSLSGTLTSSDVDNADNTFTANTIVGTNGTFSIAENGEWTFEANSAFDELNVGDSKVESFTVTSVDGTEQVVTVTINGTNDAATIAGDTSVTASETDAALSLSGTLTSSDVDNADNTFTANTIVGTNGTFSIAENGEWTFEANSAFDELNVGDSKVESFTVTSVDGTEQVVTVTINGTNDAATIAGDTSVTASETDAALSLSGTLTSSDVDNADNTFTANTIVGTNGTFSIAENGEWTFEANSAFDELNVGDSKVESFTVTSVDGTEQVVTVTINGTNDAATIAGDTSVTASETDAALSLSGTLTSSDVDNADNTFTANTIVGTNGTFSIAENGEWTFEANSAFDELNVGDSKVESFTVTSVDGTEQVVTVTINGTNDAATIAGDTSVTASETDAALSLSGTLTSSDVDNADNTFTANTIVGTNGTFSIAENGEWTFEANSAFDELNVGDSKVESFTVTSVDGTEQVVTVTINGTNDAATIAGDTSVTASETDAALSLSGTLTSSDVDNADNTFTANTIVGTNGTFSIAENGEWTFEANSAFDELNVGDSKVESFTVTSVDGTEQVVTVTINGTNDAATIAGDTSVTASETDAALSLSGTLTSSDVDNADNTFTANTIVGTNGTFSIAENGEWTFEANSAFDELNVGDSKVESFTVTSVDGTEQVVTVTINGTNDGTISINAVTGDDQVDDSEDNSVTLSGSTTGIEAGQTVSVSVVDANGDVVKGDLTATVQADGSWSISGVDMSGFADEAQYTVKADVEDAAGNAATQATRDFTTEDTTAVSLTSDITDATNSGSNDDTITNDATPDITGVTEAGATVTITYTDATGTSRTATGTADSNGNYTIAIDNALAEGSNTLSIVAEDTAGNTTSITQDVTVGFLTAQDDSSTTQEDTSLVLDLLDNDIDIDGDTLSIVSINGVTLTGGEQSISVDNGSVEISSSGEITFVPVSDYSGTVNFDYEVTDGSSTVSATSTIDVVAVAEAISISVGSNEPDSGSFSITSWDIPYGKSNYGYDSDELTAIVDYCETDLTATYSGTTNDVSQYDVAAGTVTSITGLIYLEAGVTYTFDGLSDDSFSLSLGGSDSATERWQENGSDVQSLTVTPTSSGYYEITIVHANQDGAGYYDIDVTVDDGTTTYTADLSSDNFSVYSSVEAATAAGINLGTEVVSDEGTYYEYSTENEGTEGSVITLSPVSISFTDDADGSETHEITISGLPVGAIISDGTYTYIADANGEIVLIENSAGGFDLDFSSLTVKVPDEASTGQSYSGDFTIVITATSTEDSSTAETPIVNTQTATIDVSIHEAVPVANDSTPESNAFYVGSVSAAFVAANGISSDSWDCDDAQWGDGSSKSSLALTDSNFYGLLCSEYSESTNDQLSLATLQYTNNPTTGSSLSSTTIQVTIQVAGQDVTFNVEVAIDETPNNNSNSDDTLTILTESVDVTINGNDYTIVLDGFAAVVNGQTSSETSMTVSTAENQTETFSILAHVVADTDYSGTISYDAGADGLHHIDWYVGEQTSTIASTQTSISGSVTLVGAYGTLTVNQDGSYTYDVNEVTAHTLEEGSTVQDVFTYTVTDGDGDTDTATVTIDVTGSAELASSETSGLVGNFYNVDHQISSIDEAQAVVNSQTANANFRSTEVNYDSTSQNDLGGTESDGTTHLSDWLGNDADTISNDTIYDTNDAVVTLSGGVELATGTYTMKVNADDGYQIVIDGVVVASYDANTSVQSNEFEFTVTEDGIHSIEIVYWDQGGDYTLEVSIDDGTGYELLGSDAYATFSTYTLDDAVSSYFESVAAGYEDRIAEYATSAGQDKSEGTDYYSNGYNINSDGESNRYDGATTIEGTNSNDGLDGNSGDDHLLGYGGNDYLYGGDGDDWLEGGSGSDYLYGYNVSEHHGRLNTYDESGDDLLDGGLGNDYLYGGSGDDILLGGSGDDYLFGDNDNDVLIGGEGTDELTGGSGKDLFILDSTSTDTIVDFNAEDDAIDLSQVLDLDENCEYSAIADYLSENVRVYSDRVDVNGETVANFGSDSSIGSGADVSIIINDLEFSVKV